MHTQPLGPFCQSCGMPLTKPEEFSTDAAGVHSNDYCSHCFVQGAFTAPMLTMKDMLESCVAILTQRNAMPEPQARALMTAMLPNLKRWHRRAA